MILMQAISITRAIGRGGPLNRDFFGPWNGNEWSECHLGPKSRRAPVTWSDMNNVFRWKANYSLILSSQIWTYLLFISASWESSRSSCCSGCWSAVASSLAPTLSGPAGQPTYVYSSPEPVFKTKNAGKSRINESTLFNRIHKQSFRGLGADTLTCCESTPFLSISRIFCWLTCKYFHKELTLFEKFVENHTFSWMPHCTHGMSRLFESTRTRKKVDSVVTTGIFHLIWIQALVFGR